MFTSYLFTKTFNAIENSNVVCIKLFMSYEYICVKISNVANGCYFYIIVSKYLKIFDDSRNYFERRNVLCQSFLIALPRGFKTFLLILR